jgi:probable HAF family extracellular repeat protein
MVRARSWGVTTTPGATRTAFIYNPNSSIPFTTIDDPFGSNFTVAQGINASGQVVGYYQDANHHSHGFLYNGGIYTTLDDPSAGIKTFAQGINDAGQIVGFYADPTGNQHGFLYSGGSFTNVDDPLAGSTGATILKGINDAGQIVGSYNDGNNHNHSFVLTITPNPPPPSGTTADMILRGANTSPAVAGQYEIYDIGNNAILAADFLGQVGTDFQLAGLGGFFGSDTTRHAVAQQQHRGFPGLRHQQQ